MLCHQPQIYNVFAFPTSFTYYHHELPPPLSTPPSRPRWRPHDPTPTPISQATEHVETAMAAASAAAALLQQWRSGGNGTSSSSTSSRSSGNGGDTRSQLPSHLTHQNATVMAPAVVALAAAAVVTTVAPGARDATCLELWYVFFFFNFYYTDFCFLVHLPVARWNRDGDGRNSNNSGNAWAGGTFF